MAGGLGSATIIAASSDVALGAEGLFAIGGTVATASGIGLVIIGAIGIGAGVLLPIRTCT